MIEPFDDQETGTVASIIIDIKKDEEEYKYDYHLLIDNREFLTLIELKAMALGLDQAILRMKRMIDTLETE